MVGQERRKRKAPEDREPISYCLFGGRVRFTVHEWDEWESEEGCDPEFPVGWFLFFSVGLFVLGCGCCFVAGIHHSDYGDLFVQLWPVIE